MRSDQIEAAWTRLQPILDAWDAYPTVDFPNCQAGSWGPEAAEGLISRDGRSWLAPTLPETNQEQGSAGIFNRNKRLKMKESENYIF